MSLAGIVKGQYFAGNKFFPGRTFLDLSRLGFVESKKTIIKS